MLLKLYRDGALPMSGKVVSGDVGEVLAYIAGARDGQVTASPVRHRRTAAA